MKNSKIIFLTLLTILLAFSAFGQSRQNSVKCSFAKKSTKLLTAKGWQQNKTTGKWIENKNVIYDNKCESYMVSHVEQNFLWMQFATIVDSGVKYYVLLYEQLSGRYEYPNINEGWRNFKKTSYFLFDSLQYDTLKISIEKKEGKDLKIALGIFGNTKDEFQILGGENLYNEENLLAKITNSIQSFKANLNNPNRYIGNYFFFNVQNVEGIDVIRFRLPEYDYFSKDEMAEGYFEIGVNEFRAILID